MYATICYFNYRKDISFKILKTFQDLDKADQYALQCAEEEYGEDEIVEGTSEKWIYIDEIIDGYTIGNGYCKWIYSVIYIPNPDEEYN